MDVKAWRKPTSNWIPLSVHSAHHRNVHDSWPKGMVKRFARLSSSKNDADELSSQFLSSLRYHNGTVALRVRRADPNQNPSKRPKPFSRLILPHCWWLSNARIDPFLRSISDQHASSFERAYRGCVQIGTSWCLSAPHLVGLIRKAALQVDSTSIMQIVSAGGFRSGGRRSN